MIVCNSDIKYKKLSDVENEKRAKIIKIVIPDKKLRRHFLDMGFTRGTIVKVKKRTPTGDPINIELRGYDVCARKKDLENIYVQEII